jgi:RNA polymerase sigma-70 factor, ECF subfamily
MNIEASDAVLIAAAKDGDLDAFEVLVRRHQAPVYRVALRMLGSQPDAEDVAQEVFVQAWRSLARFRGDSAFATWLYRIVTNRSLNALSARKPTVALDEELHETAERPEQVVEDRERLRAVTRGLLALAPDQRAALVLREFEGLSYDEIAATLGITVPAVKGRIHRARAALITILGERP